jgi:bifunctional non-homologous end joining protein LigD
MPGFIKPQLATFRSKPPAGDQWLHEIKYDGYRIQLHLNKGKAKAYTRHGLDWTKRFSVIAGAFDIPDQGIIDGEVVVVHEGRTNFSELQADLARGDQDRLLYYAFDLLWLDGKDLRKTPQIERKRLLKELFDQHELEPSLLSATTLKGTGSSSSCTLPS